MLDLASVQHVVVPKDMMQNLRIVVKARSQRAGAS